MAKRKRIITQANEVIRESIIEVLITAVQQNTKEIKKMASTLDDLKNAIAEIGTAVDADVEQTTKVVAAVNTLIAKIEELGQTADFQAEVDALKAATAKLASDNAAVQEAIDKAATPPA